MYEVVSNTPIMPHEQVYNTYGESLTNAHLLIHYGFLLDGNENNVIQWNEEELLSFISLSLKSEFNPSSSSILSSQSEKERRTDLARNHKRIRGMSLIGSEAYTHSLYLYMIEIDNDDDYEEEHERVRPSRRLNTSSENEINRITYSREEHPEFNDERKEEEDIQGQASASSASTLWWSWRSPQRSGHEQGQEVVEADARHSHFMTLVTMLSERWRPVQSFGAESVYNDGGVEKNRAGRYAGKRKVVCEWDASGLVYDPEGEVDPDTDANIYLRRDKGDVPAHDRRRHMSASLQPSLSSTSSASRLLNSHSYLFPSSSKLSHSNTRSHPSSCSQNFPKRKLWLNDEAKISRTLWLYCILLQLWRYGIFTNLDNYLGDLRKEEALRIDDREFNNFFLLLDTIMTLQIMLEERSNTITSPAARAESGATAIDNTGRYRQEQEQSVAQNQRGVRVTSVSSREKCEENKDIDISGDDNQGCLWGEKFSPKFPLDLNRLEDLLVPESSSAEVNVTS